jgi:hypothetical protein
MLKVSFERTTMIGKGVTKWILVSQKNLKREEI